MISKKIAWVIIFFVFLASAVASYSFFQGGGGGILSPLSSYKPPSGNGNGVTPDEPKTEECPINGEMLTKTQKTNWEKKRPLRVAI